VVLLSVCDNAATFLCAHPCPRWRLHSPNVGLRGLQAFPACLPSIPMSISLSRILTHAVFLRLPRQSKLCPMVTHVQGRALRTSSTHSTDPSSLFVKTCRTSRDARPDSPENKVVCRWIAAKCVSVTPSPRYFGSLCGKTLRRRIQQSEKSMAIPKSHERRMGNNRSLRPLPTLAASPRSFNWSILCWQCISWPEASKRDHPDYGDAIVTPAKKLHKQIGIAAAKRTALVWSQALASPRIFDLHLLALKPAAN